MKNLEQYNEKCDNKIKPIYKKRYKDNGEEYLEKVDEIDIEEDLKEKKLEIERIKELLNVKERLKQEELLTDIENEETLNNLKELSENITIEDTYTFMNKINEIKEFYNKMPKEIRMQYKDITKFTKEYLPKFVDEKLKSLNELKKIELNKQTNEKTQDEQIKELNEKIKKLQEKENIENV